MIQNKTDLLRTSSEKQATAGINPVAARADAPSSIDLSEGKKIFIKDLLDGEHAGQRASILGWVWRRRQHANAQFIVLRDSTGVMQTVVPIAVTAQPLYIESAVEVVGTIVKDDRAPGGYEIRADKAVVIGQSHEYPISKNFSSDFLLDVRHLWNRSSKIKNVMIVRERVLEGARNWFRSKDWHEVNPPIISGSTAEGGATLFELDYFGKKGYLSQSAQLYLESLIFPLEKVWSLTPSFRAEKSRTSRHLMEFWHLEGEVAWLDFEGILKVEEQLLASTLHHVAETAPAELKAIGRDAEDLLRINPPFKRVHYEEVLRRVNSAGMDMRPGDDLSTEHERFLTIEEKSPVFVVEYPKAVKPFYAKIDPDRPELVYSADMLAPEGYGEISTGGQREEDLEAIVERINAEGFNIDNYSWYLDLRKYGSVPHSGFGFGIDRIVRWVTKRETILDTIPYPRTLTRIYP
ncbi:MAG: asparagine--tRNA ligase [Candidatus Marsarchaeota archaeon]|nr:asparagine--tRNA ligase [Candidatus Marsarchaeota archaeon]